jgi:hypothetical protein
LSQSIVRVPRRAPEPRSAGATLTSAVLGLDLGPKLGLELGLDHGTARALTGSSLDAPWSPMLQSSGAPCGTGKTRDTCAQPPNQGRTALHLSASAAAPARVPCPRPVPAAIVTAPSLPLDNLRRAPVGAAIVRPPPAETLRSRRKARGLRRPLGYYGVGSPDWSCPARPPPRSSCCLARASAAQASTSPSHLSRAKIAAVWPLLAFASRSALASASTAHARPWQHVPASQRPGLSLP